MKTTSIMIQSLCIPCQNCCRYCLLSWNGKTVGTTWDRSVRIAERILAELRAEYPDVKSQFSFGYSMEHPDLRQAIRTLRRLGSPQSHFLQCDGMRMRSDSECDALMEMLHEEQIQELNFTVYGFRENHDFFAGRKGDYDLLMRMMRAAKDSGIQFSAGIPLTSENISQVDELVAILQNAGSEKVILFIPHAEGRGKDISGIRLRRKDLLGLSEESRKLLNGEIYRSEADWLGKSEYPDENKRMILISLRQDNIDDYESRSAESIVGELEALDERYYSTFPEFAELAETYGNPESDLMYRFRDLFHHYCMLYSEDHNAQVYDVTDERQSGSRRY